MNILIIAEHLNGIPKKYSLELCTLGNKLAKKTGGMLFAAVFGADKNKSLELSLFGAEKNYLIDSLSTSSISEIIKKDNISLILGSSSPFGKEFLPKLAAAANAGFAQDCVDISVSGQTVLARRPVFAGRALIDLSFESLPAFATVRPNILEPEKDCKQAVSEELHAALSDNGIELLETKEMEKNGMDVAEADFVIAGGRAMANSENFKLLFDLSNCFHGAAVGASRAAVDAGYISHDHQIGQTGKVINPKLYLACGISGSIQHLAGMKTSKTIVAINKDKEAPIFSKADFGAVGDLFEIVPLLTEKLKKIKS